MVRLPDPGRFAAGPATRAPVPARYDAAAEWAGPANLGPRAEARAVDLGVGWAVVNADAAEHRWFQWQRSEEEGLEAEVAALEPGGSTGDNNSTRFRLW